MKLPNRVQVVLATVLIAIFLGCGEDFPINPLPTDDEPELGTVLGTITDARTGQPISGAVVTMLDQRTESASDGGYSFTQINLSDNLTMTVEALDYVVETRTFVLNAEGATLHIFLIPLTNPDEEIQELLDTFSQLIKTMDVNNLDEIEGFFTEGYIASDDLVTRFFGIDTGVIPAKFETITLSIKTLFEEFKLVQFRFHEIKMNITNTRKAFARLSVDIITEQESRTHRREIISDCKIHFRKEAANWKIFFWQFCAADIRL